MRIAQLLRMRGVANGPQPGRHASALGTEACLSACERARKTPGSFLGMALSQCLTMLNLGEGAAGDGWRVMAAEPDQAFAFRPYSLREINECSVTVMCNMGPL